MGFDARLDFDDGRGHHESDWEVAERSRRTVEPNSRSVSDPSNVRVTIAIPVKIGGYTGQREEWEEYERDHVVKVDGDDVTLEGQTDVRRKISFSKRDLYAAIKMLVGQEPVYRDDSRHQQETGA